MQDKLKEYHGKREYDRPTIESMKHFPVHSLAPLKRLFFRYDDLSR